MINNHNYFFYNDPPEPTFWRRDFRSISAIKIENEDCVVLFKQGKILNQWVQRFYTIQGVYLMYGDRNLIGYTKMDTIYLNVLQDGVGHKYHFQLLKDARQVNLYTSSEKDFLNFKSQLEKNCILLNFHQEYQILKQIGRGSTSQVYIAFCKTDQQYYAIKRILKSKKQNIQKGLLNEFQIMRELNHPNILQLYKVFETNKHINLVLELVQGGELLKAVKFNNIRDARNLAKSLLLSVDYIHQKNIMHRDLKPNNILCRPNTQDIIIADFGLATYIKNQTPIYSKCGTIGYVAPEVMDFIDGKKLYSEKCDIFSLGVILFQLFFNNHPFKDSNRQQMMRKNHNVDYKYDDQMRVPNSLKDLIDRMLKANPKFRPTANEALRHEFFSENLQDYSSQQLNVSYLDSKEIKQQSVQLSFNSVLQNDMKFSTFQQYQLDPIPFKEPQFQLNQNELFEGSPCWQKKIEFIKLGSNKSIQQVIPLLQRGNSYMESRKRNISLFKQEFDSTIKNSILRDLYFDDTTKQPPQSLKIDLLK